jgi:protein gp37
MTGCTKTSPGCVNCYAARMSERLRLMGQPKYAAGFAPTFHPEALDEPLRWQKPRRVFVNSMSDTFHDAFMDEQIAAVFGVMAACPQHTHQVLTKRAERLPRWFKWAARRGEQGKLIFPDHDDAWRIRQLCHVMARRDGVDLNADNGQNHGGDWPLPNVWLGVTAEDQRRADERIPHLLAAPAAVRFVSVEPMIGPVDLAHYFGSVNNAANEKEASRLWVIVGAESGPHRRPCRIEWVRSIVTQCRKAHVPCFVKQLDLDGKLVKDPAQFPEDLRIQEYPKGI